MREENYAKERWENYFNSLLSIENSREDLTTVAPIQDPIEKVEESEVKNQLEQMKNNKSTGPDNIPLI